MKIATSVEENKSSMEFYWKNGYAVFPKVFTSEEIDELKKGYDEWNRIGYLLGRTWRKKNTIIWVDKEKQGAVVRGMQWPSYHDEVFNKIRLDQRVYQIIKPIVGENVKQIINQLHWKKPKSNICWPLHRDVRSRQPVEAFTDLFHSWVQTGIAIDPHREENGAMYVVPGSHLDHEANPYDRSLYQALDYEKDPRKIPMELEPGDVAIWNAYTVHGGGFNKTENLDRRVYINGYVKADNCLRGELTWLGGKPVELTQQQALIQFDEIELKQESFFPGEPVAAYD